MQTLDEVVKYICDRIATTLEGYGRTVTRAGQHSLIIGLAPYETRKRWRIVVRRSGNIEYEPLDIAATGSPIPQLQEHIRDALLGEYELRLNGEGSGDCVVMQPLALPQAPYALPSRI